MYYIWHIENPSIPELFLMRHIQTYSVILGRNFLFFHFSLTYISTEFKDMFFGYNDLNFNVYLNNAKSLKIALE